MKKQDPCRFRSGKDLEMKTIVIKSLKEVSISPDVPIDEWFIIQFFAEQRNRFVGLFTN